MKLSREGAMVLLAEEGIVLRAYQCAAGVWTIGAGHTALAGPPTPKRGMIITLDEALALFRRDIIPYERAVATAVKRPVEQHEFDALVSFHFNTGAIKTGSVDDKLNKGDIRAALATMSRYNKANGKINRGLVGRRKREIAMFKDAVYIERGILVEGARGEKITLWPHEIVWPGDPQPVPMPPPPDIEPPPAAVQGSFWNRMVLAIMAIVATIRRKTP